MLNIQQLRTFPKKVLDKSRGHKAILLPLIVVMALQLVFFATVLCVTAINQTRNFISTINNRVREDIHYKQDGTWDTTAYDTDPEIPGNYRLYVITKDGYVIDRWRPINGYLNTSDLRYLLNYQQPGTTRSITGQSWRLYTLPIKNNEGTVVGGITTGSYNFTDDTVPSTDTKLTTIAQQLAKDVRVKGSDIDTSPINVREVPPGISFQIVDSSNTIHVKSDNSSSIDCMPNYIDPSYITRELGSPAFRQLKDKYTHDLFVARSHPVYDAKGNAVATVIVARSVSPNLVVLKVYIFANILIDALLIGLTMSLRDRWAKYFSKGLDQQQANELLSLDEITSIRFDKSGCTLLINNCCVPITYATNQYYMCLALLGAPKKKWHTDELLEKFGETNFRDGWRKIYDSMTSINKKTSVIMSERLIVSINKTYQINPALTSKIRK